MMVLMTCRDMDSIDSLLWESKGQNFYMRSIGINFEADYLKKLITFFVWNVLKTREHLIQNVSGVL